MTETELLQIIEDAIREGATSLDLSGKELTTLPPEIGKLTSLTKLYLNDNQLTALPPEIGKLTYLKGLRLWRNQLTGLPPEIGNLTCLEELDLVDNQLTALPSQIGNFTKLLILDLSDNQLTTLPPEISNLTYLMILDVRGNQLTTLPPEIGNLVSLMHLDLRGNPLPIPPEILVLKNKPAEVINYYLQHRATAEKKRLNEAKVLIVGQGGVGKTSLVNMLVDGTYNPHEGKTEGIDIKRWKVRVNDNDIRLNIWDFAGQEITHATHQFFLTKRSLYVLVLDGRQGEQESRIEYWLKLIQSFGGDSPIVVVINKIDQHRLDIDRRGLQAKYETIKAFVETSCEKEIGIKELEEVITNEVGRLPHIHDQLLNSWFAIKSKLEVMEQDFISYEEYERMCRAEGIDDELSQRTLMRFLHDLGIVLNFQEDSWLSDTNILNPEWVTKAVYRILNSNELFQSKGVLAFDGMGSILDRERYPKGKHRFIIEMMEKFELCFGFEGHKTFLIPDLLSKEEPDLNWDHDNSLAFQYHYNFLPNSVISRFIVRMHPLISQKTYWKTGVVLKKEGNKAIVRADLEDRKIFIFITGKEQTKRTFLAIIRSHFDYIHQTIPRIEAKEKVSLPGRRKIVVDYDHLLVLEEKGHKTFVPEGSEEEESVEVLLNGVATEQERRERREEKKRGERLPQPIPQPPSPVSAYRNNPWISGSFFLFTFIVIVTASVLIGVYISWVALPVVLITGLLGIAIVGAFQLKNDQRLSDESFLTLMIESFKRLPLLKGVETSKKLSEGD
ncbi:MAG TPA: COR domain-containing protein [Pyrinomonadaceae bacterium]|nr:COR domain-containing protein [Pyrinomonadaceae bacterium]